MSKNRGFIVKRSMLLIFAVFMLTGMAQASEDAILIKNVNVFDGKGDELIVNQDVLVKGNLIEAVGQNIAAPQGAAIIDGNGRTLTPGFIDAHVHLSLQVNYAELQSLDDYYFAFTQADEAEKMLMRGFTTARDAAGNVFSLKRVIDDGRVAGPRIYPSGASIGQTGGHGDYRPANAVSRLLTDAPQPLVRAGHSAIADGPAEMLTAAREQLRRGATQVKIFTGGGVASPTDPLDTVQLTDEELRAVVQAAENWNTYVLSHVYNPAGIRKAVKAGVKSIEHANYIDKKTLDLVIKHDAWLSVQALVFVNTPSGMDEAQVARFKEALEGLDNMFKLIKAKGYKKVAFGTDVIGDPALMARQNEEFELRTQWFKPAEILRQATSGNAQLLELSGPRNPYPGKLGVIEKGA